MIGGVSFGQVHVRRLERELAALGHGVPRVHREVHEDLLELSGVGLHGTRVRRETGAQLDVLAEQAAEHLLKVAHQGPDVDHARLQDLLPAEREQLSREAGGPVGGLANFGDILVTGVAGAQIFEEQVRVAGDRGENVVEVVSDPAREPADRFHFLRLAQLLLELHALGDIAADAEDADQPSLEELWRRRELSHAIVALRRSDAELADGTEVAAYDAPEQLEREGEIFGVHQVLERPAHPVFPAGARDRLEGRVEGRDRALGGEREDHIAHAFHQCSVAFLRFP